MVADDFPVRRVIVGRGDDGAPVILSDGTPPLTIAAPTGVGVSELLSSAGPLTSLTAGGDPPRERVGAFPENGGVAARLIRFPATNDWVRIAGDDPDRPGMHRSETLDLMVLLSGRIVLGVEDGEDEVGPGDAVVQRGTLHRWQVTGDEPCTYLSVLLAPLAGAPVSSPPLSMLQSGRGPKLFVTGTYSQGSTIEAVGTTAPDGSGRRQWWNTLGPVRAIDQGGLAEQGSLAEQGKEAPQASGAVSLTMVDLAIAGSSGFTTGMHSIDLVTVLSGEVATSPNTADGTITRNSDAPPLAVTRNSAAAGDASPAGNVSGTGELSLSMGDVLITRGVDLRLTSESANLAVVSFAPAAL